MVNKKDTVSKDSKGYIKDYYNAVDNINKSMLNNYGLDASFNVGTALEAIRKDAVVLSAITTLVDKSTEYGYKLKGGKKNTEKKLKSLRFNSILRQVFYNLYAYNNVFIEIVKDGDGKVKELHVLETTFTKPIATKHGKVLGYIQQAIGDNQNKTIPDWNPEEVTHISINKLTTNIWGDLDIQAVYTKVLIKQYIDAYLGWLFGTNQFRGFYNIQNASEGQVKSFISWMKKLEGNINLPVIAEGDITYQVLRTFNDGETILKVKEDCDNDILTLFQVPPVLMGKPGDSNRSNSDSQEASLATRIRSVHSVVEDYLFTDLFPKMGLEGLEIEFYPTNKSNITKLLENAERMHNMGFKDDKIEEYLQLSGFILEGKLFKPPEEQEPQKKSMDMYESRKGKNEGETNKKIGSGEDSTTREDQIHKSFDNPGYPYVYNIEVQGEKNE